MSRLSSRSALALGLGFLISACNNGGGSKLPPLPDGSADKGGQAGNDGSADSQDGNQDGKPDGQQDGKPMDGAADMGPGVESGPDAAPDMAPDAAPDMPPDLAPDLPPDMPPDLPPDMPPDLAPDLPPDMAPDLPPDAPPVPLAANAGGDKAICPGAGTIIGGTPTGGKPPYTYAWTASPTCASCISSATTQQPTVNPTVDTTFTVVVTDSLSATAMDSVLVTVAPAATADAGPDLWTEVGSPVRLGGHAAAAGLTYKWTCNRADCALDDDTKAQPLASPTVSTQYTLTVNSAGGCVATSSATVQVELALTTSPANGDPGRSSLAVLELYFGQDMLASSLMGTNIRLEEAETRSPVSFTSSYDATARILKLTPTGGNYNTTIQDYRLVIKGGDTGIESDDAILPQHLRQDLEITYYIAAGAATAPGMTLRSPDDMETGVPKNTSILVEFDQAILPNTITAGSFKVAAGATTVTGTVSYDPATKTLTWTPAAPLSASTQYTVTIKDIQSLPTLPMPTTVWKFTTGTTNDTAGPSVTAVAPADGASLAAVNMPLTVTFDEPVDPATLPGGIVVTDADGAPAPAAISYDPLTSVARVVPLDRLASKTTYTVTASGVKDTRGNAMAAPFISTFTTGEVIFFDDMESGTAKWSLEPSWGLSVDGVSHQSASHALTDSPVGDYPGSYTSGFSASSIVVDVTGKTSFTLGYWLRGRTQFSNDVVWVEYRLDGGTWLYFTTYDGRIAPANHAHTKAISGRSTLEVRFRLATDIIYEYDGVYFDDVIVQTN